MGNCLSSGLVGLDWMSLQVFSNLSDSVSPQFLHYPQFIHIPWAWPLEAPHLAVLALCPGLVHCPFRDSQDGLRCPAVT